MADILTLTISYLEQISSIAMHIHDSHNLCWHSHLQSYKDELPQPAITLGSHLLPAEATEQIQSQQGALPY